MRSWLVVGLAWLLVAPLQAQSDESPALFPHSAGAWWVSGQANIVVQGHGRFRSPYDGANSLRPDPEHATSRLLTLFTGARIGWTEFVVDVESAGGRGISDALGLAGFTNLDVVRNPTLGAAPYLARAFVAHVIPLGKREIGSERTPLSLYERLPERRIELRAGKFSTADWFDANTVAGDSHFRFLNWTADNNGAYDYAADTRGYTVGAEVEYHEPRWALRFLEALMPTVANGITLDWHVEHSRSENLEIEWKRGLLAGSDGHVRGLVYVNHGNMGSYLESLASTPPGGTPDIEATRRPGRVKWGFGLNVDQSFGTDLHAALRLGYNEGQHESFAYTEVNESLQIAVETRAGFWARPRDRLGVIAIENGISSEHRSYLAAGGRGFLLGDGALDYGPERIIEAYYTLPLARGVSIAADIQFIANPGYNRDRGPVWVPGARLHLEF